MARFTRLLQTIDRFYKTAVNSFLTMKKFAQSAEMDDEAQENYDNLFRALQTLSYDTEEYNFIVEDITTILESYKAATSLNKGFNTVNVVINEFLKFYSYAAAGYTSEDKMEEAEDKDIEGEQAAPIEEALNAIVSDLRRRAGGPLALKQPDSPDVVNAIKAIVDSARAEQVSEDEPEPEPDTPQDQGPGGFPGEPEKEAPEEADESKFGKIFHQFIADIGGQDEEGKAKPIIDSFYVPKDWVAYYENEKNRYLGDLDEVVKRTHPKVKDWTIKLALTLEKLKVLAADREGKLKETLNAPNDPVAKQQLQAIEEQMIPLNKERRKIKSTIRRYYYLYDANKFGAELQKILQNPPVLNTEEKKKEFLRQTVVLEQQIGINEALASRDANKQQEIRLRRQLLDILDIREEKGRVRGGMIPEADIKKRLAEIEAAKSNRKSHAEKGKIVADEIRKLKESGTLAGEAKKFQQDIASRKPTLAGQAADKAAKDRDFQLKHRAVIEQAKEEYRKNPSPQSKAKMDQAEINYAAALEDYIRNDDKYKAFEEVRPKLLSYRDKIIAFWNKKDSWIDASGNVSDIIATEIRALLNEAEELMSIPAVQICSSLSWAKRERKPYPGSLFAIKQILAQLLSQPQQEAATPPTEIL